MQVARTVPIFRIFDIGKARAFYTDWLGLEWAGSHEVFEGAPLYALLKLGQTEVLHLSEHHGDGTPGSAAIIFVDGLRPWFDDLKARPYPFYNPALEAQPWGLCCTVQDPFSNRIVFCDAADGAGV